MLRLHLIKTDRGLTAAAGHNSYHTWAKLPERADPQLVGLTRSW